LSTRNQVTNQQPTYAFAPCDDGSCPVTRAVRVLDGRWTVLVVRDLLGGTRRFSQLRRSLVGVSPKTLTDRLRHLEQAGLVKREVFAEVPPRVEYSLTDAGRALEPVLHSIADWGRTLPAPAMDEVHATD
jgi:DNA-binding HxlR family transcriptional regulator